MKTIVKIIMLAVISININCQTLPLFSIDDLNTGGYSKDINNLLPFWVDTWKGTANNKEYTFQFVGFEHQIITFPSGNYYYEDKLMVKFKVVDLTTGIILYNDLSITNFEDYKIRLIGYSNYIGYTFSFHDEENHCFNSVKFSLRKNNSNPNQVTYYNFEYGELIDSNGCSYPSQQDIPMFLPKVDLVLTRQ